MRIGHGFDVHAFGGKGPLIIGGIYIPFKFGVIAHSDGDVVIHALIDALLGASGMGDIGKLFPDSDPQFKGVDSCDLLCKAWHYIKRRNYIIGNIDITIIAQEPKMSPYLPQMCIKISECLDCYINNINVKSTTTEKLGFIGRSEGIASEVLVLLTEKKIKFI